MPAHGQPYSLALTLPPLGDGGAAPMTPTAGSARSSVRGAAARGETRPNPNGRRCLPRAASAPSSRTFGPASTAGASRSSAWSARRSRSRPTASPTATTRLAVHAALSPRGASRAGARRRCAPRRTIAGARSFTRRSPRHAGATRVVAWVDHFLSWRHDFRRRVDPEDVRAAALAGAALIDAAASRADGADATRAAPSGRRRCATTRDLETLRGAARCDEDLAALARTPSRSQLSAHAARAGRVAGGGRSRARALLHLVRALSALGRAGARPPRHVRDVRRAAAVRRAAWASTCSTCRRSIRSAASRRKGRTTRSTAGPDDVGSPWAIGAREGGHKAVHPAARHARGFPPAGGARARARHRDRARHRVPVRAGSSVRGGASRSGSGSAPTAACSTPRIRRRSTRTSIRSTSSRRDWRRCGSELEGVFEFWIGEGVRIFRVDNPHTKPFAFWEWVIGEIKRDASRRRDLPRRGVHAAEGHASARQARLHAVVHLLRLAIALAAIGVLELVHQDYLSLSLPADQHVRPGTQHGQGTDL